MVDGGPRSTAQTVGRTARAYALGAAVGYCATTLVLLGIGVLLTHLLLHGALGAWDGHASAWFAHRRTPWLDDVTSDLTKLANTSGIVVVAFASVVGLLIRRHPREACLFVVGLTVELATFLTVNTLIARPRPHVPKLDSVPSTTSFPSGHIAATLTLYVLIAVCVVRLVRGVPWHRVAWAIAIVLTVLVGFARVYRGLHHVTDVVAGAVLGAGAVATSVIVVLHDRGQPRDRAEPEPAVIDPHPPAAREHAVSG
jgi:membrane-associated phospholipid phosphatase